MMFSLTSLGRRRRLGRHVLCSCSFNDSWCWVYHSLPPQHPNTYTYTLITVSASSTQVSPVENPPSPSSGSPSCPSASSPSNGSSGATRWPSPIPVGDTLAISTIWVSRASLLRRRLAVIRSRISCLLSFRARLLVLRE